MKCFKIQVVRRKSAYIICIHFVEEVWNIGPSDSMSFSFATHVAWTIILLLGSPWLSNLLFGFCV